MTITHVRKEFWLKILFTFLKFYHQIEEEFSTNKPSCAKQFINLISAKGGPFNLCVCNATSILKRKIMLIVTYILPSAVCSASAEIR